MAAMSSGSAPRGIAEGLEERVVVPEEARRHAPQHHREGSGGLLEDVDSPELPQEPEERLGDELRGPE